MQATHPLSTYSDQQRCQIAKKIMIMVDTVVHDWQQAADRNDSDFLGSEHINFGQFSLTFPEVTALTKQLVIRTAGVVVALSTGSSDECSRQVADLVEFANNRGIYVPQFLTPTSDPSYDEWVSRIGTAVNWVCTTHKSSTEREIDWRTILQISCLDEPPYLFHPQHKLSEHAQSFWKDHLYD